MFKKWDLVRLVNGSAPLVVVSVNRKRLAFRYLSRYQGGGLEYEQQQRSPYAIRQYDLENRFNSKRIRDNVDFVKFDWETCPDKYESLIETYCRYVRKYQDPDQREFFQDGTQKETEQMPKLFTVLTQESETPRFGTYLQTTSVGKIVLEMKGESGKVEVFDKSEIEEVKPFTVEMMSVGQNGDRFHTTAIKGELEVDDVLMDFDKNQMLRVMQIDTKHDSPRKSKRNLLKLAGVKTTIGGS